MHLIGLFMLLAFATPTIPALQPGTHGSFDETAVKDPSIVFAGGQWRLFYTARGRGQYSIGYVAGERLEDLKAAPRVQLVSAYAAAPQVFFYQPQGLWYLIFQTTASNYQPVYMTTRRIEDPKSWSGPRPLVLKEDKSKWIDFWVICDEEKAVLFFTRDHRDVMAMTTSLREFPNGFGHAKVVYSGVHEAVHVYRGAQNYAMLFELRQDDGSRKYGLAEARTLLEPWTKVKDWSLSASHGELLRKGSDQKLEANLEDARFLIQELDPGEQRKDYPELRWHLSVIRFQRFAHTQ